jgi:hypothetical protein
MTEVEFSGQLSQLAKLAKALNEKSDSVNAMIERFQTTLRSLNIGFEVWPARLESDPWNEQSPDADGTDIKRGFIDTELGFVKLDRGWVLATRRAQYEWDYMGSGESDQDGNEVMVPFLSREHAHFYGADDLTPLLEESRPLRIAALKHFPEIVQALTSAAQNAITTIENAETFVTSGTTPFAELARALLTSPKGAEAKK